MHNIPKATLSSIDADQWGIFRSFDIVTNTKFAQSVVAVGCIILFSGAIPLVTVLFFIVRWIHF